jgi:hypothetical protein
MMVLIHCADLKALYKFPEGTEIKNKVGFIVSILSLKSIKKIIDISWFLLQRPIHRQKN